MNEPQNPQKYFLLGIIGLGALIVVGLVWAVVSGPSPSSVRGTVDGKATFNDANDPMQGKSDSKVVVRMYEDFQCPACGAGEEAAAYAMKTYGDRVKFIWNDFPLSQIHSNAMAGAVAARCAEDQGKFWEYHDALYANQAAWSNLQDPKPSLKGYAKDLHLDEATFGACLDAEKDRQKVTDDVNEGNANGIDGTPTFFINTKRFVGIMQKEDWDRELKAALGS